MGEPIPENRLVTIRGRWIHINEEVEIFAHECLRMQQNFLNSWRICIKRSENLLQNNDNSVE